MFQKDRLSFLGKEKFDLETFDLYLYSTLNDPRLLGQIVFEYGTLLNWCPSWRGLKVLDLGSGRSTLPYWMASRGASVTTFEYPHPIEQKIAGKIGRLNRFIMEKVSGRVIEIYGDMMVLPFKDHSFDMVTSFSVIEHLDTDASDLSYVPFPEQRKRAAKVLNEMIRVTKSGGYIYLTSECCDYTKVKSDAWRSSYYYKEGPEFSGAWPVQDVKEIFYNYFIRQGCALVGDISFDPSHLNKNSDFTTFRGPSFSAFSVLARKN